MKKLLIGVLIGGLLGVGISYADKLIQYTRTDSKMMIVTLTLDEETAAPLREVHVRACGAITRSDGQVQNICESRGKSTIPAGIYADVVSFWNAMEPVYNNLMIDENTNLYPVQ
jgi:hypothetical protein